MHSYGINSVSVLLHRYQVLQDLMDGDEGSHPHRLLDY